MLPWSGRPHHAHCPTHRARVACWRFPGAANTRSQTNAWQLMSGAQPRGAAPTPSSNQQEALPNQHRPHAPRRRQHAHAPPQYANSQRCITGTCYPCLCRSKNHAVYMENNDLDLIHAFFPLIVNQVSITGLFGLVRTSAECSGPNEQALGFVDTLDNCAQACNGKTQWFIYGRYGDACNSRGCQCYCEGTNGATTCTQVHSTGYILYTFQGLGTCTREPCMYCAVCPCVWLGLRVVIARLLGQIRIAAGRLYNTIPYHTRPYHTTPYHTIP